MFRCIPILLASSLFPAVAFGQSWSTRALGGTQVHVYAPATSGARGLIVGLHGCTQTNTQLRDLGNWEPAAERYGLVIALPQVPNGGVVAGCWDYYGAAHSRTTRHAPAILQTVEALLADDGLSIDASRVYVAGLSSGAGQAGVIACLAPDVFSGVGINAGPAVGTDLSQFSSVATSAAQAAEVCRTLAGASVNELQTQLASVIHGTADFVVAQGYARLDAEMWAQLYGASDASSFDVGALEGHQPRGTGTLWSDARGPRVSLILAEGMGHAFPAGSGPGAVQSFIAKEGVAWPLYLGAFFTANHRRQAAPNRDGGLFDRGSTLDAATQQKDAAVVLDGGADAGFEIVEGEPAGCRCTQGGSSLKSWFVLQTAALMIAARRSTRRKVQAICRRARGEF